jgi:ABC-2 type transport system permease protein
VLLVLALAVFLFHVPIKGSFLLLMALSVVFLWTALGFGLLISTIAKNQLQAMQASFALILRALFCPALCFPGVYARRDFFIGILFPLPTF